MIPTSTWLSRPQRNTCCDRDLLVLADSTSIEGEKLHRLHPELQVLEPATFLKIMMSHR
jgi:hypothetical protein